MRKKTPRQHARIDRPRPGGHTIGHERRRYRRVRRRSRTIRTRNRSCRAACPRCLAGSQLRPRGRPAGRLRRADRRVRHGQVGARGAQGGRHPGLHGQPGHLRAPGGGIPRRFGHGAARGRLAAVLEQRGDHGTGRPGGPCPPVRPAADRGDGPRRLHPGDGRRCRAAAAARARGVCRHLRAHHQHDDADGARRRARRGAADPARLHRHRLPRLPPRRAAGRAGCAGCAS